MDNIYLLKSGKFFYALALTLIFISFQSAAQWTKTGGPPGLNVNTFFQKGNTLFCGTSAKGVFKSLDNGVTWSAANSGIEDRNVFSLVATNGFVFAGTDQGVFRSSNNGTSWALANTGIEDQFVYSFQVANGYIFAGTISFGVFKSNDQGATWTDANGGALGSSSIYALTFSSPNLIAFADNLIFYSNDNGSSWFIPQNSPFLFSSAANFVVQGDSVMINTLQGVFRSFDDGQSWDPIIVVDDNPSFCGLVRSGKRIYIGSASKIYFTTNFGITWTLVNSQGLRVGARFNNEFYKSGNNLLLAFDEIGVAYSSDKAKHWSYTLSGFPPASSIDNAILAESNTITSGTHSDGVYRSTDAGSTWTKIGTPNSLDSLSNGTIFSLLRVSNKVILAGACGFGLYRSANNGSTWTHITSGLPAQDPYFLCVFGLAKSGSNALIATDLGLYYSTDGGLTWNASNITGFSNVAAGVAANGTTACAAVNVTTGSNQIYRSTNSGQTWSSVFSTSVDDFVCIASDGVDHFYAGTFGNNYLSNNNGSAWQSFGSGIPAGSGAFTIATLGDNVFVGNSEGVFFSNDNAQSFIDANEGMDPAPNNAVQGLAISSTHVYAGLFLNAIWKRPLSDFNIALKTSQEDVSEIKVKIVPNPVSHQSVLGYEVSENSHVEILIYDLNGNLIKTLMSADKEKGIYQEQISKGDLAAGEYLVVISAGNKKSTIKFTIAE